MAATGSASSLPMIVLDDQPMCTHASPRLDGSTLISRIAVFAGRGGTLMAWCSTSARGAFKRWKMRWRTPKEHGSVWKPQSDAEEADGRAANSRCACWVRSQFYGLRQCMLAEGAIGASCHLVDLSSRVPWLLESHGTAGLCVVCDTECAQSQHALEEHDSDMHHSSRYMRSSGGRGVAMLRFE